MKPLRGLLVGVFLLGGFYARARLDHNAPVEQPKMLTLRPSRAALLFEYENRSVENKVSTSPATREDTWYVEPGLQLGASGSFYHSSLLDFNLTGEFARQHKEFEYEGFSRDAGGGIDAGVDTHSLQNFDVRATLLKLKPYAVHVQAARQDFERHQDYFTREEVDATRWSVRGGYDTPDRELIFRFADSREDITGRRDYSRDERSLRLTAARRMDRDRSTELDYSLRDILHLREQATLQDGQIHEWRFRDQRPAGMGGRAKLSSSATYTDQGTLATDTQRMYLNERLTLQHSDDLRSTHQYRLHHRTSGGASATAHFARSLVRHQLFDSLTSTGEIEGNRTQSESEGVDTGLTRIRAGFDEVYTKRLRDDARLNLGLALHGSTTRSDSSAEQDVETRQILGETLVLSSQTPTALSQPGVDPASVVVTDLSGARAYEEGIDYRVVERGGFTEIQRIVGGAIPEGGRVRVDYTTGNVDFDDDFITVESRYAIRLNLLHEWLMLHARQEELRNFGGDSNTFPTYVRRVYGAEAGPGWSKTGVEVDDNDSSQFPYEALRVYENMTFSLPLASTLVLDLSNTWRDYRETGEEEEILAMTGHVRSQVAPSLTVGLSGGYLREQRAVENRDLTTAQADMEYRYGKLEFRTGYDYNDESQDYQYRTEHRLWVRMRRWF